MAFKNNMKMFRDICNVQHDKQKELFFFFNSKYYNQKEYIKRNYSIFVYNSKYYNQPLINMKLTCFFQSKKTNNSI